jgi:hypothetical protein
MAVNYALELSDRYRDFFFYVFRRNDGTFLVDNAGIRYDDETLIAIYHNTEQI